VLTYGRRSFVAALFSSLLRFRVFNFSITVRRKLSDGCLSCPVLSVTLVYCGQTVGWINMPLGTEVGLGLGDVVLDGDPVPPAESGTAAPDFSADVYCGQTVADLNNC